MKITIGKKEAAERLYRIDEMWSNGGSYRVYSDDDGKIDECEDTIFLAVSSDIVIEIVGDNFHAQNPSVNYDGWLFRRTNESITISFEE